MTEVNAKCYRAARSDGSIGSLQTTIEETFNLPEGSIRIVKPNGRAKRADASVQSLRSEWGE